MKTNEKYLLLLIVLLAALIFILIPAQPSFAAQAALALTPTSYHVVIDPPNNQRSLLFKGKLDGMELKGWWLDVSVNGQALETLLKTHPKFRFVITARDGKKTEVGAEQYLKGGLRFPDGNPTVSLFDNSGVPVFENLKVQAGGGDGSGSGGSPASGSSGGADAGPGFGGGEGGGGDTDE